MAENGQLQRQEAAQQAQQAAAAGSALCKHCGAALDPELSFCTNCGEKTGGEERECGYCSTRTTKEFCPHCGRRVISANCPQCGTPSINDVCEKCGAILNSALEAAAVSTQQAPEPAKMSAEEAAKIAAEFKALEQNESPEFKAFQKKLIERQILLEERDYFNKREKRIIKAFGSRPFTLELPDPTEEAFRMKAYAGLEKTVIERDQKAIEAELEKKFPPLSPVEKIDDAELKRRRAGAEAERQRWIAVERQKLEQERRKKLIAGVYYHGNPAADYEYIKIIMTLTSAHCMHHCGGHGDNYGVFRVNFDGTNVTLTGSMTPKGCPLLWTSMNNFRGTLNESGTILSGYWDTLAITHYKI
ncbi:MAG: hypothetical protein LBS37_06280 [Treponema sp.]|jgi:hypothetical protein|nr:hypothetical protein [Treponema sp.]